VLNQARRGTLPGMVTTGATFAGAAAEYLRDVEHDRGRKPSTLRGDRSTIGVRLLPAFGELPVEAVTTTVIEAWLAGFEGSARSRNKVLIQLHGILGCAKKIYGPPVNVASDVEKLQQRASGEIQVFSPEEVWALVRAAADERDGAVFLTAAFTGLRVGELLALRWRDIDSAGSVVRVRASYYLGQLMTPKSGKVRAVPLAPAVASALALLSRREHWTGDDDLVFVGAAGGYLDGSALRRRYKAALTVPDRQPARRRARERPPSRTRGHRLLIRARPLAPVVRQEGRPRGSAHGHARRDLLARTASPPIRA
jgi:integrase